MIREARSAPQSVLLVVWLAMTAGTVVYVVVAFLSRPGEWAITLPDFSQPLELALAAAALMSVVLGFVLPRMLGVQVGRALAARREATDEDRLRAAQVPVIVQYALFESVAIYGFVMVFAGSPASRIVPFAAAAFALLFLHPPKRARIEAMLGE